MVVGIDDSVFWHLTPKTIQVYFKAYRERRKVTMQDMWSLGAYFRRALMSTPVIMGSGKTVDYPEMPFKEEDEQELAKDENWLQAQRLKAFEHFKAILGKNKK